MGSLPAPEKALEMLAEKLPQKAMEKMGDSNRNEIQKI